MAVKKTKAKTRLSAKVPKTREALKESLKEVLRNPPAALQEMLERRTERIEPVQPIESAEPVESDRERRIRLATASKAPRAVTETDAQVVEKDFDFGA